MLSTTTSVIKGCLWGWHLSLWPLLLDLMGANSFFISGYWYISWVTINTTWNHICNEIEPIQRFLLEMMLQSCWWAVFAVSPLSVMFSPSFFLCSLASVRSKEDKTRANKKVCFIFRSLFGLVLTAQGGKSVPVACVNDAIGFPKHGLYCLW